MNKLLEQEKKFGCFNYNPPDEIFVRGRGIKLYTEDGTEYLDFQGAYSANIYGHCFPPLVEALKEQMDTLALTSRAFRHNLLGPLCEQLADFTGLDRFLPMVSGGEAVETMIKAARKYAYTKMGVPPNQGIILTCADNFHGRTTTVISFSSQPQYRDDFGPHTPGFYIIPFGDADIVDKLFRVNRHNVIGVLIEPIQGEGGINIPPEGYLTELRRLCDQYGKLLLLDEVQTGFGRTGYRFAYNAENILPDLVALGKALGGGLIPVSGVMGKKEIMEVFQPGDHGSTFGGYTLACRAALETLKHYEPEKITEKSFSLGRKFIDGLRALNHPGIETVRGRGLMVGLKPAKNSGTPEQWRDILLKKYHILTGVAHDVVRFTPPIGALEPEHVDYVIQAVSRIKND